MGRIKRIHFAIILFIFLIVVLMYNINLYAVKKSFVKYSNSPIESISTLSTRTAFVTNEGDVYITGRYFCDLDTSIGFDGFEEHAYKKLSSPVKIFGDSADTVMLTSFGGFITQQTNLYIFTIEQSRFKTPRMISSDCIKPVNALNVEEKGYCCIYINTNNELVIKAIDGEWLDVCMENVLNCKYYSNGVYVILKTDGSLWMTSFLDINNLLDTNYVKVADNVKSFAYSHISFGGQGIQNNFVLLAKDGTVYKKFGINANLQEICKNAKDVGIHNQKTIVITAEGNLVYFDTDDRKAIMKAENVDKFSVTDDIVCAYSQSDGLLFWGTNKYNAFGCATQSSNIALDSEPVAINQSGNNR